MIDTQPLKFINKEEFLKKVYNKKLAVFTKTKDERVQFVHYLVFELGFTKGLTTSIMERSFFYFNPSEHEIHNIRVTTGSMHSNFDDKNMKEVLFEDLLANSNKQELLQNEIITLLGENKNKVFNFNEIHDAIVENAQELVINTLDYLVDKKLLKEVIENNETKYTLK